MTIPRMVRRACFVCVVLCAFCEARAQQVRDIQGVIDADQAWTGLVRITADTTIQGAVVTVSPGTIIEFAPATPGESPQLTLGSAEKLGARLILSGTADQPITIRTRPGATAGRLVLNLQSRMPPAPAADAAESARPAEARIAEDMVIQHVKFEDLGPKRVRPKTQEAAELTYFEPAVVINASGMAHALALTGCEFARCARLQVNGGDGSRATLTANRFADSQDRTALEVFGRHGQAPAGQIALSANRLDAGVRIIGAPALLLDNILIGREASIVVEATDAPGMKIRGNYVHNTTKKDDGHYCLNCDDPNADIEDNVFVGGTTVVLRGSRRMTGNVFIGAASLESDLVKNARTHQLVQALPAGARFERNLLLGPAYSLLRPQPAAGMSAGTGGSAETALIQCNVFDGFDKSNKAIQLNALGTLPARLEAMNNLFLRVPVIVHNDAGKAGGVLAYLDYNAVAPKPAAPYVDISVGGLKRGSPGWASKDVVAESVDALRLVGGAARLPDDCDERLNRGQLSIAELRRTLFEAYRPRPGSPLAGAGRSETAGNEPPSIGALNPVERP